jgi:hypothetical protein
MAKEVRMKDLICDCGNMISWVDVVELGFKDPDIEIVKCKKCNKEHKLEFSGTISSLTGTVREY